MHQYSDSHKGCPYYKIKLIIQNIHRRGDPVWSPVANNIDNVNDVGRLDLKPPQILAIIKQNASPQ